MQRASPSEYQATFNLEPWSGGIASVRLVERGTILDHETKLYAAAFPSPVPEGLTGLYAISYPATGEDMTAVFTNISGGTTTVDLGAATGPAPLSTLIPDTTVAAFAIAGIAWLILSGIIKARKPTAHE